VHDHSTAYVAFALRKPFETDVISKVEMLREKNVVHASTRVEEESDACSRDSSLLLIGCDRRLTRLLDVVETFAVELANHNPFPRPTKCSVDTRT